MTFNDFIKYLERNNFNWVAIDDIIFVENVGSYHFDEDDENQLKELVSEIEEDSWWLTMCQSTYWHTTITR